MAWILGLSVFDFFFFYFIGFVSLNMGRFCCKLPKIKSFFGFPPFLWRFCSRQIGHQKHNIPQELIWVFLFCQNLFGIFSFLEFVPT